MSELAEEGGVEEAQSWTERVDGAGPARSASRETSKGQRYVVVYDDDCGPCTRFKEFVEFLDAKHRLRFASLVEADRSGMLATISPALRFRSFHLVSPEGKHWSGGDAVPSLMSALPWGATASRIMGSKPSKALVGLAYSLLSKAHESGACRPLQAGSG